MFLINRYGILHSYPDDRPLPTGARQATASEVAEWQAKDARGKAVNRAEKKRKAAERAQLVVMQQPGDEPGEPEPKGRGKDDGKPTA